jgi:hypothetical protein
MKRSQITILILLAPILIAVILYMVFASTDPLSLGPGGVLGVFALIYLECLAVTFVILRFGMYWLSLLLRVRKGPVRPVMMAEKRAYYVASVLAFAPVILLAMHAYAQLRVPDVLLVVVFMSIVTFYILKRR